MTVSDYLTNPMGKGASTFPMTSLKTEINNEFSRLKDEMKMFVFLKSNTSFVILIKIPSRSVPRVVYDAVLEFDISTLPDEEVSILSVPFRFFSNCPSFSYTYANIFNEKGLLCTWLKDKYDKKIFKNLPEERNAYHIVGFERTLYLACKYLTINAYGRIPNLNLRAMKVTAYSHIANRIQSQKDVEARYKREKDIISKAKETNRTPSTVKKPVPKSDSTQRKGYVSRVQTTKNVQRNAKRSAKTTTVKKIK